MKKMLFSLMAAAALCLGASLTSCDKESRTEIIGNLIDNGLEYLTADSTTWLAGTWAYNSSEYTDTLWIGTDSVFSSHTIMKDDSTNIDLYRTGGYIYYRSFKQMLVHYNAAYDFTNKKSYDTWDETYIYNASKIKITVTTTYSYNTLSLEELDPTTGESLGSATYSFVSDNTSSPYAQ